MRRPVCLGLCIHMCLQQCRLANDSHAGAARQRGRQHSSRLDRRVDNGRAPSDVTRQVRPPYLLRLHLIEAMLLVQLFCLQARWIG
jgi:hypothetical protein